MANPYLINPEELAKLQRSPILGKIQDILSQQRGSQGAPEQPQLQEAPGGQVASGAQDVPVTDSTPNEQALREPQAMQQPSFQDQMMRQQQRAIAEKATKTAPLLEQQGQDVADLRAEKEKYKNMPQQWNMAPLLAYADSLSGGNTLKGYAAPMTAEEKQAKVVALQDLIQKAQGNYTKEQIAALQDKFMNSSLLRSNSAMDRLVESHAFRAHKDIVDSLNKDPQLKQQFTQLRNLDNASTQVVKADHLTPQSINEYQQAIRSNLGIKGDSVGAERLKNYYDSLGWRGTNAYELVFGKPGDIAKDDALVQHLKNLASVESDSVKGQINDRVGALTSGFDSVYEAHPKYKQDLMNKIKSFGKLSETKSIESGSPEKAGKTTTHTFDQDAIAAELAKRK